MKNNYLKYLLMVTYKIKVRAIFSLLLLISSHLSAQYYWQVTSVDTLKGTATYCVNAAANAITLNMIQCAGGGSKPHNSTSYTLKWYVNSINSNTGGTVVSSSIENTAYSFVDSRQYTPSTSIAGTFYYYAELSSPSKSTCGFTNTLTTLPVRIDVKGAGIIQHPGSVTANSGNTVGFKAKVPTGTGLGFQWQSSVNMLPWTNITDNAMYSGSTSDSLTVSNILATSHLQQFRLAVSAGSCNENSNVATIHVKDSCLAIKSVSVTDTLFIQANLGSGTIAQTTIKVYPNPTQDKLSIRFNDFSVWNGYTITLYDVMGKLVYTAPVNANLVTVDLSTLSGKGTYFLKMQDSSSNTVVTKTVILK